MLTSRNIPGKGKCQDFAAHTEVSKDKCIHLAIKLGLPHDVAGLICEIREQCHVSVITRVLSPDAPWRLRS